MAFFPYVPILLFLNFRCKIVLFVNHVDIFHFCFLKFGFRTFRLTFITYMASMQIVYVRFHYCKNNGLRISSRGSDCPHLLLYNLLTISFMEIVGLSFSGLGFDISGLPCSIRLIIATSRYLLSIHSAPTYWHVQHMSWCVSHQLRLEILDRTTISF